jgi:3-dehydroquinate synthase
VALLTDSNVAASVLPKLNTDEIELPEGAMLKQITIAAGDSNKSISTAQDVWSELSNGKFTRRSLLINVGGGMVTDLGGFVAATFKRGIACVNISTTLLGAVDASIGGKTAVNFLGFKNEIGVFSDPVSTIISPSLFNTLPHAEMLSGMGETVKTALLDSPKFFNDVMNFARSECNFDSIPTDFITRSLDLKRRVVEEDPHEHGLRKCLNLGHTAGHAIESLLNSQQRGMPHGIDVAWGLAISLIISHTKLGLPTDTIYSYIKDFLSLYPPMPLSCNDYNALLELMSHDKKNPDPNHISFTLLSEIGKPVIDCFVSKDEITSAFDIFRDIAG